MNGQRADILINICRQLACYELSHLMIVNMYVHLLICASITELVDYDCLCDCITDVITEG
jgi:hypothetical protein